MYYLTPIMELYFDIVTIFLSKSILGFNYMHPVVSGNVLLTSLLLHRVPMLSRWDRFWKKIFQCEVAWI